MELSAADVKYELENLRSGLFLEETEHSWEKIGKSITSLIKLCEKGGYDANPSELVTALRAAHRQLVSTMNSERTRLCLNLLDLMSALVSAMGGEFEQLLALFMQPLITLCGRTNKVVINRARTAIFTIIESSQSASLLTYFLHNIKDKSATLKVVVSEATLACLNSCNPPDLEKETRAVEIEAIIRATARDASADVRKVSRKIFESYKILFPSRVLNFTAPLSPTTKKYLDIKAMAAPTKPMPTMRAASAQSKPDSKSTASNSTTSTIRPSTTRSASSTLSTTNTNNPTRSAATTMTRVARKEPTAPASYAPARTVQPARIVPTTQKVPSTSTSTSTAGPVRPVSSIQAQKRPAPPLRSQASTVSRVASVGATSSSAGAHRLQLKSTAATPSETQPTFSGPRRVPMPAPAPVPVPTASKEAEGPKRPISRVDNTTTTTSRPRTVTAPAAPIKKKSASTLPSSNSRVPTANPTLPKARSTTSTASAAVGSSTANSSTTTRIPATVGSTTARPLVVAKAKPQWGGRPAVRAKPAAGTQKAPTATTLVRKPSSRVLPRAAAPVKKGPVIPAMVALPPSPTPAMVALPPSPTPDDDGAVVETVAEGVIKADAPEEDIVKDDVEERQTMEVLPPQPAPEDVQEDEQQAEPVAVLVSEAASDSSPHDLSIVSEGDDDDANDDSPNNEENDDEETSSMVSGPSHQGLKTPQGLLPLPATSNPLTAKTPISALLSSIERGFTYSPITPLSPADLYLPNVNGDTPYTHQPHAAGPRQPFNYALHAPSANGMFGGFAFGRGIKKEEELVRGDIGVINVSEHNKLFSQMGMDDPQMRHAFLELNQ